MKFVQDAVRLVQDAVRLVQDAVRPRKWMPPCPIDAQYFGRAEVKALEETALWRSRHVMYCSGGWEAILAALPEFKLADFNPFLQQVVRTPRSRAEKEVPLGVVSRKYGLVPHRKVSVLCRDAIVDNGVDPSSLRYELGLSQLSEWMNLRIYFPKKYSIFDRQGEKTDLRLECFNSVDGSSRLVVLFGWIRFICSNGMIIGKTRLEIRERHAQSLDLDTMKTHIGSVFHDVKLDRNRMRLWDENRVSMDQVKTWIDTEVAKEWGKKAAVRVFYICTTGQDVRITGLNRARATEQLKVTPKCRVPGSPELARTRFDVAQALSFVASQRNSVTERVAWQTQIRPLLERIPPIHG